MLTTMHRHDFTQITDLSSKINYISFDLADFNHCRLFLILDLGLNGEFHQRFSNNLLWAYARLTLSLSKIVKSCKI